MKIKKIKAKIKKKAQRFYLNNDSYVKFISLSPYEKGKERNEID